MNKVGVIVNPVSAGGKTAKKWEMIKQVLHYHFSEFKYEFTQRSASASLITSEFLKIGCDLIIGVGGDGTFNEILNGFINKQTSRATNEEAALGIIASGTGSDFARLLKIPRDFTRSVKRIKSTSHRLIDVGKIVYKDGNGAANIQYFLNVADFGLSAEVVKRMQGVPSGKKSGFSYYKGLLSSIKNYHSKNVTVVIDDKERISDRFLIGAVANGRMFGSGMIIAPKAEIDDGLFDLVLVKEMSRLKVVGNSIRLYNGTILNHPRVSLRRAKKVSFQSNEDVPFEFDGEAGGRLPVELEVLPGCLKLRI